METGPSQEQDESNGAAAAALLHCDQMQQLGADAISSEVEDKSTEKNDTSTHEENKSGAQEEHVQDAVLEAPKEDDSAEDGVLSAEEEHKADVSSRVHDSPTTQTGPNQDSTAMGLASPRRSPRLRSQQEHPSLSDQLRLADRDRPRSSSGSSTPTRTSRQRRPEDDDESGQEADGDEEESGDDGSEEDDDAGEDGPDEDEGSIASGDSGASDEASDEDGASRTEPELAQDCQKTLKKLVKEGVDFTKMLRVTPPQLYHKNWASFKKYHTRYCRKTHQVLPIKETMNYIQKNIRIKKTAAGKSGQTQLIPASWDMFQKTFICTHGWDRTPRGDGVRPKQYVNSTSCPFRFVVQMQPNASSSKRRKGAQGRKSTKKVSGGGGWYLMVKSGFFGHNHPIDSDTYDTYPVARGVVNTTTAAEVSTLIKAKSAPTLIYDLCLERGENVFKRDIDNMIQKQRALATSRNEDDETALVLTEFASPDGNSVSVAENELGETAVISLTSAHQRSIQSRFPEMLMIDTTHKTNRHNYQLLTFMTMDEFGEGRVVQHSLLETNSDWHMNKAINHFMDSHEKTKLLRVIIVDKDLNEIRVLKQRFNEARILICTFHVIKYLSEKCRKPEYGKHSQEDLSQVDAFVHKMTYADSAETYDKTFAAFQGLCERMDNRAFLAYFEANWNTAECKDMWVYYRRAHLPHFRNNTNNRLENFFGKLKKTLKPDSSMPECLRKIISHGRRVENEYKKTRSRLGHAVNQNYDKEMSAVLRLTTHWVAENMEPEYAAGLAKSGTYLFTKAEGDIVIVQGCTSFHRLNIADYRCDCKFAQSMLLPCRHAIAYNKHHQVPGAVVPTERIDDRWRVESLASSAVVPFRYTRFREEDRKLLRKKRTREQRFNAAKQATDRLASEVAEISDEDEFQNMIKFFVGQWRNVRNRKRLRADKNTSHDVSDSDGRRQVAHSHVEGRVGDREREGESRGAPRDHDDESMAQDDDDREIDHGDDGDNNDEFLESTQEAQPLSQAHSLYSEDLGSVSRVDVNEVRFQPTEQLVLSQSQTLANEIAAIKIEKSRPVRKALRMKAVSRDQSDESDVSDESLVSVRLNRKAVRPGRPSLDRKVVASKAKISRQRAAAAQAARDASGEVSLVALCESIERDQPGLDEIAQRLSGLTVQHEAFDDRKPKFSSSKNPRLNQEAFYLLPEKLLKACSKALPMRNTVQTAISLVDDASQQDHEEDDEHVDIVTINNLGSYSRKQITTMYRLMTLKKTVTMGLEFCRWLIDSVKPAVDEKTRKTVVEVEADIRNQYPSRIVPGLGDRDAYCYSMLYRVQPPEYLNDAIIDAFCQRLSEQYPNVRYGGTPDAKPGSARTNKQKVPPTIQDRVKKMIEDTAVDIVLIPVNFGNSHFCGILVDSQMKDVIYYDSLNSEHYLPTLKRLSLSIKEVLTGFSIHHLGAPVQFDSYSCGMYVCYFFHNHVASDAKVVTKTTLDMRRWDLLNFVMFGQRGEP